MINNLYCTKAVVSLALWILPAFALLASEALAQPANPRGRTVTQVLQGLSQLGEQDIRHQANCTIGAQTRPLFQESLGHSRYYFQRMAYSKPGSNVLWINNGRDVFCPFVPSPRPGVASYVPRRLPGAQSGHPAGTGFDLGSDYAEVQSHFGRSSTAADSAQVCSQRFQNVERLDFALRPASTPGFPPRLYIERFGARGEMLCQESFAAASVLPPGPVRRSRTQVLRNGDQETLKGQKSTADSLPIIPIVEDAQGAE